MKYERILLTDDGSPLAAAAAPYAAAVARANGGEVLVLRVVHGAATPAQDVDHGTWTGAVQAGDPTGADMVQLFLRRVIEDARPGNASRVGALTVQGEPRSTIPEVARRIGADIIVMASHGYSGFRRALLGSVSDYVARHVEHIPVLICRGTPPAERDPFARIAVTLDETPFAEAALEYATALNRGSGGSVELIRVLDAGGAIISSAVPWSGDELHGPAPAGPSATMVHGRRPIDPAELAVPGLHLEPVPDHDVGAGIIGSARATHCGVIVMSTHGRGPVGRAIHGSVGDQVSHLFTSGAVLLVHPAPQP